MSAVPARLAGFAVVLVVAFGGAYAVGSALGPLDESPDTRVPAAPHRDGEHGG